MKAVYTIAYLLIVIFININSVDVEKTFPASLQDKQPRLPTAVSKQDISTDSNKLRGSSKSHRSKKKSSGESNQRKDIPRGRDKYKKSRNITANAENLQMNCTKSFEPTCDMYSYVRFWNQRFYPEDCYESPLRPATREQTPYDQQKYVVFEPDWGGWNNIRMSAEAVMIFAHATGRTLVMPPNMVFYLLDKGKDNKSTFHKFFDFRKVKEGMNIITMEDFIENVAKKGLLKISYPNNIDNKDKLYDYIEQACYIRQWTPTKFFVGFNISSQYEGVFGTYTSKKKQPRRYKEMIGNQGRKMIPYDNIMDAERAIHFSGRINSNRLLTHYYTFLYWEDPHIERIYNRIVRDRLHYHDDIFCGAGRVVQRIHHEAARLTGLPLPSPAAASPKTLGGDTNRDATYFAYHIRRGDFQYSNMKLSAEQIWANTQHLLNSSITTLIYIATDERNKSFFEPFMRPPWTVRFLDTYLDINSLHTEGSALTVNHLGMLEQVVCANAHTFIGTPLSTFTGYIMRMRGKNSSLYMLNCNFTASLC